MADDSSCTVSGDAGDAGAGCGALAADAECTPVTRAANSPYTSDAIPRDAIPRNPAKEVYSMNIASDRYIILMTVQMRS